MRFTKMPKINPPHQKILIYASTDIAENLLALITPVQMVYKTLFTEFPSFGLDSVCE